MGLGFFVFGLFAVFRACFYWVWGCSNHFLLVLPSPPPALCLARVRVFTPLSEAQHCRFFAFVQFRSADALLNSEPGGDQGTLFAHNVVQGYVWSCMLSFFYFCVVFVLLYKKYFKDVSHEFDEFRVNTHLCKLRCWYL